MAYQPINLGEIYQNVAGIKAQQQRGQLEGLQIQQAQKGFADQNTIDTAISNPNATQADYAKAGMAGLQAYGQKQQLDTADLTNKYRKLYITAKQVSASDNPAAAVAQLSPDIIQNYDATHGPGAFAKLTPDQIKQNAENVANQAMEGLIDPTKAYEAHTALVLQNFKQNGAGGEMARKQAEIDAENARNAANIKKDYGVAGINNAAANARDLKPVLQSDGSVKYLPASQAAGQPVGDPKGNPLGSNVGGAAGLTGDAYLQTLPPNIQTQVKALSDGRMAFPTGAGMRSPYWQQMIQAVGQYDPNFDAVNYNARSKTRGDFTSGKSAQNIKSLNTAIGHLGTLDSQIAGTASHSFTPLNTVQNAGAEMMGSAGPTQFTQTAGALASELTQVFRGSGGAEADVKRYLSELSPNASMEQKKAAVANIVDLLHSRISAIGDQYNQGMGTTADPLTLLNPKAKAVLDRIEAARSGGPAPQAGPKVIKFSDLP